jgi:hypothetical protein
MYTAPTPQTAAERSISDLERSEKLRRLLGLPTTDNPEASPQQVAETKNRMAFRNGTNEQRNELIAKYGGAGNIPGVYLSEDQKTEEEWRKMQAERKRKAVLGERLRNEELQEKARSGPRLGFGHPSGRALV